MTREELLNMAPNKKQVAVFRSVYEDAPPNPFLILFILPVALFCVIVSHLYEKSNNRNN
jgi:hypothetical protein